MRSDVKHIEINEYNDSLKDVKPHLDEAFDNLSIREVRLFVDHPASKQEAFQKRLKKIMKYCTDHDRSVEVEYAN